MELDVNVIKDLINTLNRSGLGVLRLETSDFKLTLERQDARADAAPAAPQPAAEFAQPGMAAENVQEKAAQQGGKLMKSPIVGTFYESASPEKPPFARVGQKVKCGDILYIIESMKLMNEIACDFDGTVEEIMVRNGQAVEYGQPIMRIV